MPGEPDAGNLLVRFEEGELSGDWAAQFSTLLPRAISGGLCVDLHTRTSAWDRTQICVCSTPFACGLCTVLFAAHTAECLAGASPAAVTDCWPRSHIRRPG